jgi:hypothetical protein
MAEGRRDPGDFPERAKPSLQFRMPRVSSPPLGIVDFVSETVMQIFRETGAYDEGHFRLTSGLAPATLDVIAYAPEHGPLCKQGGPPEKPGSRPTA